MKLEFHLHGFFCRLFVLAKLEEFPRLESECAADDVGRELLNRILEVLHYRIVETARRLDFVLGIGEFALEFDEIRIRFQVGITFGNREERLERAREHIFRFRVLRDGLRTHRFGARLGHLLQCARFMGSVAFYRLDKIRNEVVAPLELYINIGPCFLAAVREPDEIIVSPHEPHRDDCDNPYEDVGGIHIPDYITTTPVVN